VKPWIFVCEVVEETSGKMGENVCRFRSIVVLWLKVLQVLVEVVFTQNFQYFRASS
jgi:hypothetical protein